MIGRPPEWVRKVHGPSTCSSLLAAQTITSLASPWSSIPVFSMARFGAWPLDAKLFDGIAEDCLFGLALIINQMIRCPATDRRGLVPPSDSILQAPSQLRGSLFGIVVTVPLTVGRRHIGPAWGHGPKTRASSLASRTSASSASP